MASFPVAGCSAIRLISRMLTEVKMLFTGVKVKFCLYFG